MFIDHTFWIKLICFIALLLKSVEKVLDFSLYSGNPLYGHPLCSALISLTLTIKGGNSWYRPVLFSYLLFLGALDIVYKTNCLSDLQATSRGEAYNPNNNSQIHNKVMSSKNK